MTVRERLGRWLLGGATPEGRPTGIELRSPVAATIGSWEQATPQYPDATGRRIEIEGGQRNPVLAAGLRQITATFSQATLRVCNRASDEDVPNHPLEALLRRPEPRLPQVLFWKQALLDWYQYGNVFWEIVRGKRTGQPLQLWRLEPRKISIVPGTIREADRYEFEVDGKWWPIPSRDVIHIRDTNPNDHWFGASPLLAALRSLATDNEATDFLKVTLQNLAVPSVVIEIQGEQPDATTLREIERKWSAAHRGDGLGKATAVGNARVRPIGFSLEQLAFEHLSAYLETRILMVLGGASLVYMVGGTAAMGANTYANYGEAREAFISEVVSPLWNLFDDVVSQELLPQWRGGDALECYFDTSEVPGAEGLRLKRLAAAGEAVQKGLLTREQGLRLAGQNKPEEGEVLYVPAAVDPMLVGADGTLSPMNGPDALSQPPTEDDQKADQTSSFGTPTATEEPA